MKNILRIKITFIAIIISMMSLSSCEVLQAVLEQAAQQQQQQQQEQQNPSDQSPNTVPAPSDGKVLNSEEDTDNSKSTIENVNSEMYAKLNMSDTQITKYEAIIAKYKAQSKKLLVDKKGDRSGLRTGLNNIKANQDIELKNLFSSAQYTEYNKMMDNDINKSSGN